MSKREMSKREPTRKIPKKSFSSSKIEKWQLSKWNRDLLSILIWRKIPLSAPSSFHMSSSGGISIKRSVLRFTKRRYSSRRRDRGRIKVRRKRIRKIGKGKSRGVVKMVRKRFWKGTMCVGLDLKDASLHVPMSAQVKKFLRFKWKGKLYEW